MLLIPIAVCNKNYAVAIINFVHEVSVAISSPVAIELPCVRRTKESYDKSQHQTSNHQSGDNRSHVQVGGNYSLLSGNLDCSNCRILPTLNDNNKYNVQSCIVILTTCNMSLTDSLCQRILRLRSYVNLYVLGRRLSLVKSLPNLCQAFDLMVWPCSSPWTSLKPWLSLITWRESGWWFNFLGEGWLNLLTVEELAWWYTDYWGTTDHNLAMYRYGYH